MPHRQEQKTTQAAAASKDKRLVQLSLLYILRRVWWEGQHFNPATEGGEPDKTNQPTSTLTYPGKNITTVLCPHSDKYCLKQHSGPGTMGCEEVWTNMCV